MAAIRAAAEKGDASAQTHLGRLYATGKGVPHDDAEGMRWLRLAVAQGHALAQYNLGILYSGGVPRDDAEVARWFRRAAAQGHAGA